MMIFRRKFGTKVLELLKTRLGKNDSLFVAVEENMKAAEGRVKAAEERVQAEQRIVKLTEDKVAAADEKVKAVEGRLADVEGILCSRQILEVLQEKLLPKNEAMKLLNKRHVSRREIWDLILREKSLFNRLKTCDALLDGQTMKLLYENLSVRIHLFAQDDRLKMSPNSTEIHRWIVEKLHEYAKENKIQWAGIENTTATLKGVSHDIEMMFNAELYEDEEIESEASAHSET